MSLVFGEDETDRKAIGELGRALRPDLAPYESRRTPIILVKGRPEAEARKVAAKVANVVRADQTRRTVTAVLAHEDCDAVEPAHTELGRRIEEALAAQLDVPIVAVAPAWEIEAWWFLWPDAVVAVNPQWARPARSGTRVGLLENAKEQLRRAVRGRGKKPPRDFEPSDGPAVAGKVRELGLIDAPDAISDSFGRFRDRLRGA